MKYNIILLPLFCLLVSCNSPKSSDNNEDISNKWNTLTIISEGNTVINIQNDTDFVFVKVYHTGSIFSRPPKNEPTKIDTIKSAFPKNERDSLMLLAKDIISNPVKVKNSCTEFIGHLEVILDYGAFVQKGEYSSVCDWTNLSDKTLKLHKILKRHLKGVYLGEQ